MSGLVRHLFRTRREEFAAACNDGLSVAELMERFGICIDTLYRWKRMIGLPPMPRGHQVGQPAHNRQARAATCADCGAPVCWLAPGRAKLRLVPLCRTCAHNKVVMPTKPPRPTGVKPGPEKADVLMRRYERGEFLHHPDDAQHEE